MTVLLGWDAISTSVDRVPPGLGVPAGYCTGTGDVPWTEAQWAAYPEAIRIDQSPLNTAADETADVLDVENGAATIAEVPVWFRAALSAFERAVRPGQRYPCLYVTDSNIHLVANALVAAGITQGPRLWIARWGIPQGSAAAMLSDGGPSAADPFPVVAVQYASYADYDADVFSSAWVYDRSAAVPVAPPAVPPVPVTPPAVPPVPVTPPAVPPVPPVLVSATLTGTYSDGTTRTLSL